jgi:hypothetical protein
MNDVNEAIAADVGPATDAGVPVKAHPVGTGFGPDVSAGLWIVPFLRIGATYSQDRARDNHEYSQPGFVYQDDFGFQMRETGLEAAVRVPTLAGFTVGGGAAQGRAEASQNFVLDNGHGTYTQDLAAQSSSCRTYTAFFGFDQTNSNGVAGFLRVGYHWRKVGAMPGTYQINDDGSPSTSPGLTPPADFSGWSVRLGCGYDLKW